MPSERLLKHFRFDPEPRRIEDLETPVPVIDLDVVEQNLTRWQSFCDAHGLKNRPHIKTHKLASLAKAQVEFGARGITVQKIGEAEVMAAAGLEDQLLTFNVLGKPKLDRLASLARRFDMQVVADNELVVESVGRAGEAANRPIRVMVECDTGAGRNGVQTPEAAAELAKRIDRTKGIRFGGLMTYAKAGNRKATDEFLIAARGLCEKAGLEVLEVTTGGSPDMWSEEGLSGITEYRAGTYIYNDRALLTYGTCSLADCALTVLTTVVSRPVPERGIIDAGSKALTSDLNGMEGYGIVPTLGGAKIYAVNEEHGYLDLRFVADKPKVGDLLRVLPNHVCPVSNLFDRVVFVAGNEVLGSMRVDARGTVQ